VKLWICGSCDAVHMSLGKSVLGLDCREFFDFSNAVNDLRSDEWAAEGKAFSILDLVAIPEAVLKTAACVPVSRSHFVPFSIPRDHGFSPRTTRRSSHTKDISERIGIVKGRI